MAATTIDQQRLLQRESQLIPWIANPLIHFFHHNHDEHRKLAAYERPEKYDERPDILQSGDRSNESIYEIIEAGEATPMELFYDLFFVANLTTITATHEMTDYESVVTYILFFVILWFTWLQTTLYDIRFAGDSVYERIIKVIHFAVMMGLASVSTDWNPLNPALNSSVENLRVMSLTLMVSRLALGVQYGVAMVFAWKHKKGILPLAMHSFTMVVAALVYLGIALASRGGLETGRAYWAWYGLIIVEILSVMTTASIWKVVSFKRTHLVQRMGLLTLIIMGEGIIVMLKAVNAIQKGLIYGRGWSPSVFFVVACAIGIIYLFFIFYFDYNPRNVHYGTIRQQFWAVMHFPYHLAVVLAVEGLHQLATFWSFMQAQHGIDAMLADASTGNDEETRKNNLLKELGKFLRYLYDDGTAKEVVKNYSYIKEELANLTATPYADWTANNQRMTLLRIITDTSRGYAEFYGIKVPTSEDNQDGMDPWSPLFNPYQDVVDTYRLVFTYFFVAVGVVCIMYGILGLFVRRKKDAWDYFSVALRMLLGVAFLGMERIQAHPTAYHNYLSGPWPIPTIFLALSVTLAIDKAVGLLAYRRTKAAMKYK